MTGETVKPDSVNILGKIYQITYCDKPSDVDIFRRESIWGQVDYWTHTIRIYNGAEYSESVIHTLLHEILHVITWELDIKSIDSKDDDGHDQLDRLALALADFLNRNKWLKTDATGDNRSDSKIR